MSMMEKYLTLIRSASIVTILIEKVKFQIVAEKYGFNLDLKQIAASFKHQWITMNKIHPHFGSTTTNMGSVVWWHQLVKVTQVSAIRNGTGYLES